MSSDEAVPVAQAIERLLGALDAPSGDLLATVFGRWDEVVGTAAAQHCRPLAVEGDRLVVAASDPVWASELRWLAASIIDRANEMSGEQRLRSMSVRVAADGP